MKKTITTLALLMLGALTLSAHLTLSAQEYTSKIDVLKGGDERWWGIFIAGELPMPFEHSFESVDLESWSAGQTTPLLISSRGRYIWSEKPFSVVFTGTSFLITSSFEEVKAVTGGRNLREAYLVCCHKNFPPSSTTPNLTLFSRPIYDTSVELGFEPSGDALLYYADQILQAGYPAGTLIVAAGWQGSVGSLDPSPQLYGDFGHVVEQLQNKGFKVMLTITPYVSADGRIYRQYKDSGVFVHEPTGKISIVEWAGGYSGLYDMSYDASKEMLQKKLDSIQTLYGVDGFQFDCAEAIAHLHNAPGGTLAYLERWSEVGERYDFCQYTIDRGKRTAPYIHSLKLNAPFDWAFLKRACADIIDANLLGYPYTTVHVNSDQLPMVAQNEPLLLLRYLQMSSVMPVMYINFAPWRVRDPQIAQACKAVVNQRMELVEYFLQTIRDSKSTAEPLLRHMEYEFPRFGFADCKDQFMIGSKYLVAPLLTQSDTRTVRFPRGTWIDADGKRYKGPLVANVTSKNGAVLIFQSLK